MSARHRAYLKVTTDLKKRHADRQEAAAHVLAAADEWEKSELAGVSSLRHAVRAWREASSALRSAEDAMARWERGD